MTPIKNCFCKLSFLVVSHDSIRGCVRPSVRWSVGRSVRNNFFLAGRDEPANDLFRVYELVNMDLVYASKEC